MTQTCRKGHPLVDGSFYMRGAVAHCRICRREQQKLWRINWTPEYRLARKMGKRRPAQLTETWRTDEALAKARALFEQGIGAKDIAAEIGNGCTKVAIKSMAARRRWIAPPRQRKVRAKKLRVNALGYSAEQKEAIVELWATDTETADIRAHVNQIGPAQLTNQQISDMARRFGARRPASFFLQRNRKGAQSRWATNPKPKQRQAGAQIPIPLREVYQRCAQLDVPRAKRGSVEALNAAMRRIQPDHPGFAVADFQPTRLRWAI
jgi:hypothetical protein